MIAGYRTVRGGTVCVQVVSQPDVAASAAVVAAAVVASAVVAPAGTEAMGKH